MQILWKFLWYFLGLENTLESQIKKKKSGVWNDLVVVLSKTITIFQNTVLYPRVRANSEALSWMDLAPSKKTVNQIISETGLEQNPPICLRRTHTLEGVGDDGGRLWRWSLTDTLSCLPADIQKQLLNGFVGYR